MSLRSFLSTLQKVFIICKELKAWLIFKSEPSIKSATIDMIAKNIGFMDPSIRRKRYKSYEVYKIIQNIQHCGPHILKATEELIPKIEEHQNIVKKSTKQLEKKYLKEKEELNNQIKYLKKADLKHLKESNLKIQRLVEELNETKSKWTQLSKKLELIKNNKINQKAQNDELEKNLCEYKEIRKCVTAFHNSLINISPSYKQHLKPYLQSISFSNLLIEIFWFYAKEENWSS